MRGARRRSRTFAVRSASGVFATCAWAEAGFNPSHDPAIALARAVLAVEGKHLPAVHRIAFRGRSFLRILSAAERLVTYFPFRRT